MQDQRLLVRRGAALAVLVMLLAGPAGVAGVLHPFDDAACAPREDRQTLLSVARTSPARGDAHCPTCHLLRHVRVGVPAVVATLSTSGATPAATPPECAPLSEDPCLSPAGRSPPSESSPVAA